MKLGVSYVLFDGEELLEYSIKSIRQEVDYISVVYQNKSYFGNNSKIDLFCFLEDLNKKGLVDEFVLFSSDYHKPPRENEIQARNLGVDLSKKQDCTHHISLDVDEFYFSQELNYAKKEFLHKNYDSSIVELVNYYKHPTYQIFPPQKQKVSFIQKIDNYFGFNLNFPYEIDFTRRPITYSNIKIFEEKECKMHHMSFVRKDISQKIENSSNKFKKDKFINDFNKYKLGDRLCVLPDYKNRRTILVENYFKIEGF